jgi:[acyl-carrier-protein] S-malonyltransferase
VPYAVIFPGQGAAAPAAGDPWRTDPAWAAVERAEAVLETPLARLVLDADADELATTRASQLAVLLTSLMAWDCFSQLVDERPVAFAGHSLGQITALLAAEAVGRDEGLLLAGRRADLTQQSADAHQGKMAALMGADPATAEEICAGLDAWVANDNAPGQVVIAGTGPAVDDAAARAREQGVRKVIELAVGHAFHTPLLADAAESLRPLLDSLRFTAGQAPVVANTDGQPHDDPAAWPELLARHLVEPVRWRTCQETIATLGADTLIEVGPGRILAGLARRTVPELQVLNVATPEDAATAADALSPVGALTSFTSSPSSTKDTA